MFWLWFSRIFVTLIAFGCLVNMFKQLSMPYAPRTVVKRDGSRVRQGTLDNVLDGAGAVWGTCMWIGLAAVLWLI